MKISKRTKRWLKITGCGTAIVITLLLAACIYFIHYSLGRDSKPYNPQTELEHMKQDYPWTAHWIDSIQQCGALRDTIIVSKRGVRLHAWYVPAHNPATTNTAVIVHGYKSNPMQMMQIGYLYHHDMQWNILLPDQEAHAQSEGKWIGMGWYDRLNTEEWMKVAHRRFNCDTMVVHGISMGAATTMCVSGDSQPPYVRAFVEDCGYTSVWDEFKGELHKQFGLPAFPLLHVTSLVNKLWHGWSFKEASPLRQVASCTKPMLFIHGTADTYVPTWMVHPLYDAKPGKKALWLAPGSEHANAYRDHYQEYTRQVMLFLSKQGINLPPSFGHQKESASQE